MAGKPATPREGPARHCCKRMAEDLAQRCARHPSPFDCPDNLMHFSDAHGYGIIVHDGGSSFVRISFCPWCGANLASKRKR